MSFSGLGGNHKRGSHSAALLVFLCLGILQGRTEGKRYGGYSWLRGRSETLSKHVSVTFDLSGDLCVVRLALLNQIDVWQKNLTLQELALIYFCIFPLYCFSSVEFFVSNCGSITIGFATFKREKKGTKDEWAPCFVFRSSFEEDTTSFRGEYIQELRERTTLYVIQPTSR